MASTNDTLMTSMEYERLSIQVGRGLALAAATMN